MGCKDDADRHAHAAALFDNDDITGLAKVFTGLSLSGTPFNTPLRLLPFEAYYQPLQMFDQFHSKEQKEFLGTTIPADTGGEESIDLALDDGLLSANPTSVTSSMVSGISAAVGEAIGGSTRAMSFQSACCSGVDSIGRAAEMVALGETDIAICGGTEAPLFLHPMLEFRILGLAPGNPEQPGRQCRPFDR